MLIRAVRYTDPLVAPLLAGLADEYLQRYGPYDLLSDTEPAEFDPPGGVFVVALDEDGTTVAGGGLRRVDATTCEVKRMWTAPTQRRHGLAARVLTALEDTARNAGYERLVLETGPAQPEAAALYRGRGYREVSVFGPHDDALAFELALT